METLTSQPEQETHHTVNEVHDLIDSRFSIGRRFDQLAFALLSDDSIAMPADLKHGIIELQSLAHDLVRLEEVSEREAWSRKKDIVRNLVTTGCGVDVLDQDLRYFEAVLKGIDQLEASEGNKVHDLGDAALGYCRVDVLIILKALKHARQEEAAA